ALDDLRVVREVLGEQRELPFVEGHAGARIEVEIPRPLEVARRAHEAAVARPGPLAAAAHEGLAARHPRKAVLEAEARAVARNTLHRIAFANVEGAGRRAVGRSERR